MPRCVSRQPSKVLASYHSFIYTVNWTQALLQVKMGEEMLLPCSKHISPPSYSHTTLLASVLATEKGPISWDQGNKPPPSNTNLVWGKTQFLHVIPLRPAPTTVLPKSSVSLLFYCYSFYVQDRNPLILLWGFKCWKMCCPATQLLPKVKQPPGSNKELRYLYFLYFKFVTKYL